MSRHWLFTYLVVIGFALTTGARPAHAQISIEPSLGTSGIVEPEPDNAEEDPSMMSGMPEYQMSNPHDMPVPSEPTTDPTATDNEQSENDKGSFWSQFFQ
ncbi:hypothetical protein [Pseudovibrio sp. Alg231-02]|uniref:hypothetical protein n=1 Tax=Pseudovibrio sp. Alg231-02 TaxID=1922223 RepID=UPI000D54B7C8|nr:hypothetical protein [Pseudovibrio sp. Alg231-02]